MTTRDLRLEFLVAICNGICVQLSLTFLCSYFTTIFFFFWLEALIGGPKYGFDRPTL